MYSGATHKEALIEVITLLQNKTNLKIIDARIGGFTEKMYLLAEDEYRNKYNIYVLTENEYTIVKVGTIDGQNFDKIDEDNINELDVDLIKVKTRSGEIKYIAKGSTVLDFAFKIHREIGFAFKYAIVNDSKTKINSILTIKEENEKELNEYRDNIKNYINSLNTENLRTDQIEKINDLKSEYLEKLDLATSKADMDNLKQEVETKYDTIINSSTPNPSNDGCNCKTASAIVITLTTAITLLAFVLRKKK